MWYHFISHNLTNKGALFQLSPTNIVVSKPWRAIIQMNTANRLPELPGEETRTALNDLLVRVRSGKS